MLMLIPRRCITMVHVCEEPETSTQVAKSTQSPSRPAFALFPRVLELGASLQGDGVGFAAVWDNARVLPPGVTRAIATMHVTVRAGTREGEEELCVCGGGGRKRGGLLTKIYTSCTAGHDPP